MKKLYAAFALACWVCMGYAQPIKLHSGNSHYFEYKNKPVVLIASGMHYGAVLNRDMDYDRYLSILGEYGFNLHREFIIPCYEWHTGDQWGTIQTPLSPRPGRLLSPYGRSAEMGGIDGLNKFDLNVWNEEYFRSLKDFCGKAQEKGIFIEIVLFTVLYGADTWETNPLNCKNNINGVGSGLFNEYTFSKDTALLRRQKQLVSKVVRELNGFDNVYFEICNEPYWAKGIPENDTTIKAQHFLPEVNQWQRIMAETIVETEQTLPKTHLIAQNLANTYYEIDTLCHPGVTILNFHYAFPPGTVRVNYWLNLPIAFDETVNGCDAPDRRTEAWAFFMAGGAVYNNLDWSFAIDDQSGKGRNPQGQRRSGVEIRQQLSCLKRFMESIDFIHSKPLDTAAVQNLPEDVSFWGLENRDSVAVIYFLKRKACSVQHASIRLSSGVYELKWIDPIDVSVISVQRVAVIDNTLTLEFPPFADDLVCHIKKAG
jgi:hypothetical protein